MSKTKKRSKLKFLFRNLGVVVCLLLALATLWLGGVINPTALEVVHTRGEINPASLAKIEKQKGVYDWQPLLNTSNDQMDKDLGFLKSKGINVVYLDISNYIDFEELQDAQVKDEKINALYSSLRTFVELANKKGIGVQALAGNTKWGYSDYAYVQIKFLDFVQNYNLSVNNNQRLIGMQFDIEIYNDSGFNKNKKDTLDQYILSLQSSVRHYTSNKYHFSLGYTMPYWYDNENNNLPLITYNKKSAPIAYHIFDVLNQIQNSYAVILDYRNTVDGTDGSVAHAQNEVTYISNYTKNVKLVIGQETTNVQPSKITFYSKDSAQFLAALQRINKTFQPYSGYDGIAINDLGGLRATSKKISQ